MASMIKDRYEKLAVDRSQFLRRAQHNALLTLPSLVPLDGHDGKSHLVETYSGLGARGVVHLSSRLTTSLLPAGRPFLRFNPPPQVKLKQGGKTNEELNRQFAIMEQLVQQEVEHAGWRTDTLPAIQQLIVAGNVLEEILENNALRHFRIDSYAVRRDYSGRMIELVFLERLDPDALPEGLKAPKGSADDEKLELYTLVVLGKDGRYKRTQEIEGRQVGGPDFFAPGDLPYRCLRWSTIPGEHYGRGLVEELAADLRSLEGIEKSMLEQAAMASRNFTCIAPGANALATKNRLNRGINGDTLIVDPTSIELKSFVNTGSYQLLAAHAQHLRESLSMSFLLASVGQRNAERVTATEIERDISELEAALGGVFSTLAYDMMEWRAGMVVNRMIAQDKLPPITDRDAKLQILTGLEALSREREMQRAVQFAQVVAALGPDAPDYIAMADLIRRIAYGAGFADMVADESTAQQRRQQRLAEQAMAQGAAQLIGSAGQQGAPTA